MYPGKEDMTGGAVDSEHVRSRRGFAAMSPEKQREIASKGGRVAHEKGAAHQWTADEAREAGRKGGSARHGRKHRPERLRRRGPVRGALAGWRNSRGRAALVTSVREQKESDPLRSDRRAAATAGAAEHRHAAPAAQGRTRNESLRGIRKRNDRMV